MKLQIELCAGPNRGEPTRRDMQKNIDAIDRVIEKTNGVDSTLLIDTKSILEAIQKQLPC